MRLATIGKLIVGGRETVVERVGIEDGAIVMDVRPAARAPGALRHLLEARPRL